LTKLDAALLGHSRYLPAFILLDIIFIRDSVRELRNFTDVAVHYLYHNWSEYFYSASWMTISPSVLKEFEIFLLEEDNELNESWIIDEFGTG
jgi:hypothetical protein